MTRRLALVGLLVAALAGIGYLMQWQDGAQKLVLPTAVAEAPLRLPH